MKGSTFKRCPCRVRRDVGGRRLTCAKAHGSWSYMADVPATEEQKRRQTMKGGFPTRKVAEAALAEYLGHVARGEVAVADRRHVDEYLEEWLTGMRLSLVVSAWTNYRSILELYVRSRIGHIRLSVGVHGIDADGAVRRTAGRLSAEPQPPTKRTRAALVSPDATAW